MIAHYLNHIDQFLYYQQLPKEYLINTELSNAIELLNLNLNKLSLNKSKCKNTIFHVPNKYIRWKDVWKCKKKLCTFVSLIISRHLREL